MIVDLFAGPGGWDEGLAQLGVTDVLGVENEPNACATAEAAGHKRLNADIAAIAPHEVEPDVEGLIGSPPCPGFSAAGKGLGRKDFELLLEGIQWIAQGDDPNIVLDDIRARQNDIRSALTLEPLRWALDLEPEWIALEQVPTVLPLWQAYADVLRADGYSVWTGNMQAEQYGVPQTRKRAVLMASRRGPVAPPVPTHSRYYPRSPDKLDEGVAKWVSMAEALGWPCVGQCHQLRNNNTANAAVRLGDTPAPTLYFGQRCNYCAFEPSEVTYRNNPMPNQAQRPMDKPAPTLAFGHQHPEWCYRRPSTTIVGSFKPEIVAAPGYRTTVSRQNAPDSVRVTVQEAGVLQSFRPDYPWHGAKGKQFQQVGNAVPPLLAAHVLAALTGVALESERAA
jgi:DNA (cytosine-5)-methyltransferase 1